VTGPAAVATALALPLGGSVALALLGRAPRLRDAAVVLLAVVSCLAVLALAPAVSAGSRPELVLGELFPGLALAFRVEPLGLLFAGVASGLWILTSIYAVGYLRHEGDSAQTRFQAFFALSIGAALIVAFSANLLTLFLGYEALTLSTYPLVTHHGTDEARRAGRTYLGLLMGTSIAALLLAILWTWHLAGTLDFRPGGILAGHASDGQLVALTLLFAYGTGKAALMPFHRWLPRAMVAPAPVSALLHAVAVVKAGAFTVVKVVVYTFGLELFRQAGLSTWLGAVASVTLVAASLVALRQENLKLRLAYSTVSQLAYIVLGASLANPDAIVGAGLHVVMHAFGKITLFLCAGGLAAGAHATTLRQLDGIGRRMPYTMGAFTVAAASIVGLPPLGGAWSKWHLALGAAGTGAWWQLAVLLGGSLLSLGYLAPVVVRAFFRDPDPEAHLVGTGEAPLACVVVPCVTAAGCLVLFFAAPVLRDLLLQIVG